MYVKVYSPTTQGGDYERWKDYYKETEYDALMARIWRDPTFRLLQATMPRDVPLLEGGCGLSQVVVAMRSSGFDMIGVDYEKHSMRAARRFAPSLPLTIGDVTKLPLRNESVGGFYLNGVIEHFEDGPAHVLSEARRILLPGGVMVISVPVLNVYRRLIARVSRRGFRMGKYKAITGIDSISTQAAASDWSFFFYLFALRQIKGLLDEAGFTVNVCRHSGFLRGMLDIKTVSRLHSALKRKSGGLGDAEPTDGSVRHQHRGRSLRSWLNNAYVSMLQDELPLPGGRYFERLLRTVFGHTVVLVCHKR